MTRTGTAHFESVWAAIRYYGMYEGNPKPVVEQRLAEGSIFIGKPKIKEGQKLLLVYGRYVIEEGQ